MLFNPEKNFVTWNTEFLDTYHDIVVSFDFCRYSTGIEPQGGFAVVFFDLDADVPVLGAPGYSLGYTPAPKKDYCYQSGYRGFRNGYIAVGFDLLGEFGLKTESVDGLLAPQPNSCTIRGSQADNYKYIATSKNFFYTPAKLHIAEKLNSESEKEFKTIKIIISKAFTEIEVLIKRESEKVFNSVLKTRIPLNQRTGVKVGITNTFMDNYTRFDIKNFNVAGFPGAVAAPILRDCLQVENLNDYVQGYTTIAADDYCIVPAGGNINIYEVGDGKLNLSQVIQDVGPLNLLGGNDKFIFTQLNNTYNIDVHYRVSNSFYKTQTINLKNDVDPIYKDAVLYPICADTDNKFLAVGDGERVYVFNFDTGFTLFGSFGYRETLTDHPSGFIGRSVQVDNNKLVSGGGLKKRFDNERYKSFIACYEYNGYFFDNTQNLISPLSGNYFDEFGSAMALQGNELIIGSPNSDRRNKTTIGQGEAYHYVYAKKKVGSGREWRVAMELGNFYKLDTPGGNFGTHVSFYGNSLIVSAPYENYHYPADMTFEGYPNAGRVYIFRKNRGGTFSQAAMIAPEVGRLDTNMYYGKLVSLVGNIAGAAVVPYKDILKKADLDFFKIGCVFDIPPAHLSIDEDSYGLYDSSGYIIDMESNTHMKIYTVKLT
jgi:hypothetical protein